MSYLYTKSGRPLTRSGDDLFNSSGKQVGRIQGNRVFDPHGRYVGTVDGDIVVYRSTDSAVLGSAYAPSARAGSATAPRAGSAIWGDEPPFDE